MSNGIEQILGTHTHKNDIEMANKHIKRCLALLIVRKMQTKTTVIYCHSFPRNV